MKSLVITTLVATFAVADSHAESLFCGWLLDTVSGELEPNQVIEIDNGRILHIEEGEPGDATIVLGDSTCLPGLIDLHTHITSQQSPSNYIDKFRLNATDLAFRSVPYAEATLQAGFTTVRDLGDRDNLSIAMRDAINQGHIVGPRIFTAGKALATTGGHADPTNGMRYDLMGDPGPRHGVVNGAADIFKAVRQRYKDGADVIKITATGGVLSVAKDGMRPQFSAEELQAVVAAAQDYGFRVAAHAHGAEGIRRAAEAGIDTIEHASLLDDAAIDAMKRNGTWYIPTLLAGKWVVEKAQIDGYFPEIVRPKAKQIGAVMQDTFRRAYSAGVKIGFGTDSGVSEHGRNAEEFALMVAAGMPPVEAIQAATINAADVLNQSEYLGQINPGFAADIIAVPGNPLDSISLMGQVHFVMKDGVVYAQPE